MIEPVLREMTRADYDRVREIWLRTPGMGLNDTDDSRAGIDKYLARNPGMSFVCELDGRIAGAILAGHDGRRGIISHTAVLPEFQKRGIGRALVGAVLGALRREGISKVFLVAFKDNGAGNAFWEKMGFSTREDLNYRDFSLVKQNKVRT